MDRESFALDLLRPGITLEGEKNILRIRNYSPQALQDIIKNAATVKLAAEHMYTQYRRP